MDDNYYMKEAHKVVKHCIHGAAAKDITPANRIAFAKMMVDAYYAEITADNLKGIDAELESITGHLREIHRELLRQP